MVVMLPNHLHQVHLTMVIISRRIRYDVNNGNLLPSQQAQFITCIQQSVILRIMGYTDKIASYFFYLPYVTAVHFVVYSHSYRCLVLMAVHPTQLIRFPIQTESLVCIKRKPSETYLIRYLIQDFTGFGIHNGGNNAIQCRHFWCPQLRIVYYIRFIFHSRCFSRF